MWSTSCEFTAFPQRAYLPYLQHPTMTSMASMANVASMASMASMASSKYGKCDKCGRYGSVASVASVASETSMAVWQVWQVWQVRQVWQCGKCGKCGSLACAQHRQCATAGYGLPPQPARAFESAHAIARPACPSRDTGLSSQSRAIQHRRGNLPSLGPRSCARKHARVPHARACKHARMHACTHARMHACTHARMHACTRHLTWAKPIKPPAVITMSMPALMQVTSASLYVGAQRWTCVVRSSNRVLDDFRGGSNHVITYTHVIVLDDFRGGRRTIT
jgi:hypothetical protein